MTEDETKLWKRYQRARRPATRDRLRNQLCERYLPLAWRLAARIYEKTGPRIDFGDLHSAACSGLLDAIPRFDLSRGLQPPTFLSPRIIGAMRDYLRSLDTVSRVTRGRINRVEAHAAHVGHQLTPEEIYDHFGWRLHDPGTCSLSDPVYRSTKGTDVVIADTLATYDRAADSDASYLLKGLTARSRLIVLLYYVEGLSMRETAQAVGLSESRISQLMPRLLDHMRRNTTHLDECKEMERNQPRESEHSIRTAV